MVIILASPAGASIGILHDTLRDYQATLSRRGWQVRVGRELMEWPDRAKRGQASEWTNQATLGCSINQLIDEVLENLAKEDANKVTQGSKSDIARIACQAIAQGVKDDKTTLNTGIRGSLRYRVGVFRYRTYYGPGTGSRAREEWVRRGEKDERLGLAPLIALMPWDPGRLAEAHIRIYNVPADAEVFFDGHPTTRKGRSRHFTTPALEGGKMYPYKILVRWQKDGKTLESSCIASISGGDSVNVDFFIYLPEEVPVNSPAVTDE